jgi:hypothetical protein
LVMENSCWPKKTNNLFSSCHLPFWGGVVVGSGDFCTSANILLVLSVSL